MSSMRMIDHHHVFDISNIFWKFIAAVVKLKYEKLQKTNIFKIIQESVFEERQFVLIFDNNQFLYPNISALLYGTFEYLQSNSEHVDEVELLRLAIQKIEAIVNEHEMIDAMNSMSTTDKCTCNDMDSMICELDDLLRDMSI